MGTLIGLIDFADEVSGFATDSHVRLAESLQE